MKLEYKNEKERVKEFKLAQQRGSMRPKEGVKHKFEGQTANKLFYDSPVKDGKGQKTQQILPFNMLAVAHGLRTEYRTTA